MNAPIDVTNICIETERLLLRSWQQNDLDSFYINAFEDEDELQDSVEKPPIEIFQRILDNIIEERKTFALVLKESGEIIGSLGLQPRHNDSGLPDDMEGREISYGLYKSFRGKGYMTEAVKAVCSYCFDQLHYDYLTCGYFDGNDKSKHVMERSGFKLLRDIDTIVKNGDTVRGKLFVCYKPTNEVNNV